MPAESSINTTGSLTLVVAWGVGGRVHARKVQIGTDIEGALRSAAEETTSSLTDGVPYSPDSDQEDATHVTTDRDELLDTDLIRALEMGSSLTLASDDELRRPLTCYAVVIGSTDDKTVFVRKVNPVRLATKSVLATLVTGALTRLETPLFAFEDTFDVIVTSQDVFALHQKPFEMLFRDSDAVLAKAGEWVQTLAGSLPVTTSSRDALLDAVRSNSVYRRKLHSILARGHLANLAPAAIKDKMSEHGLDHDSAHARRRAGLQTREHPRTTPTAQRRLLHRGLHRRPIRRQRQTHPSNRRLTVPGLHPTVRAWRNTRNYTAIGNLGEHIALRILEDLGYQVLATQVDLVGGVSNILEMPTRMNPEDFIVVAPDDNRLLTVNAKTVTSRSTSGRRKDGSLRRVHLRQGQGTVAYTTRAGPISPLDDETDGQIIKLDLLLMEAQVFDITDDGTQTPASDVIDIAGYARAALEPSDGYLRPPTSFKESLAEP